MSLTMVNDLFLAQFRNWIKDLKALDAKKPGIGAGTLASGMELWLWSLEYLQASKDANGKTLYGGQRQGVTFPMGDALAWLLGSRQLMLDTLELERKGPESPVLAESLTGFVNFYGDLSYLQAARAAGEAAKVCAELVYGYHAKGMGTDAALKPFEELRVKLDRAIAGARLAKDRAAEAVTQVMIPEALDYPL